MEGTLDQKARQAPPRQRERRVTAALGHREETAPRVADQDLALPDPDGPGAAARQIRHVDLDATDRARAILHDSR